MANATGLNVAVVDLVRVLDDSALGKSGAKQVESLYQQQQRELAPLLQQAKQKKPGDPIARQIDEKHKAFEAEREKLRVDLRNQVLSKTQPVVQQLATAGGFDMVIARPQGMVFVRPELDLTARVITALDAATSSPKA